MRHIFMPIASIALLAVMADSGHCGTLQGRVLDRSSRKLIPARLYIESMDGKRSFYAKSASPLGSAITYKVNRGQSRELHTTLSAHPYQVQLPAGKYRVTALRGKEYHPQSAIVEIDSNKNSQLDLFLTRWTNMAKQGWYSGDTHVHRKLSELPNVILAEDLNVALPLTYWVTDSEQNPARDNRNKETIPPAKLIKIDSTHVIWPINTEYEIFTVGRKRHTLGAIFFLNHRKPLTLATPPIGPIARAVRSENKVLMDLDKHNWPWSMMLPPVVGVNLFELTNNHVWRTKFLFRTWYPEYTAPYMKVEKDKKGGFTEKGWIQFGLENYYTMLNCGFPMQPTGGTASGVHPVPLGFGRVYVHLPKGFDYDQWIQGLSQGRSFVTTGPMLRIQFSGQDPGAKFTAKKNVKSMAVDVTGLAESRSPLDRIEVVVNGVVRKSIVPANRKTDRGGFHSPVNCRIVMTRSSWLAVRCFQPQGKKRFRFAHTAPAHVNIVGRELRPRRAEVEYLIRRIEKEIARHRGVLSTPALKEFETAGDVYRKLLRKAK